MRKTVIVAAALGVLSAAALAQAAPGDRLRERIEARRGANAGAEAAPAAAAPQVIAYGRDPQQSLNFFRANTAVSPAPLVLFVHGGGWSRGSKDNATGRYKAPHYTGLGYAFASIDYRLVPDATVEQQAADVAAALKALLDRAGELGIDRGRVVLMGHSAGAHLVALVGTDEQYLRGAGLSFGDVDGVIPIDGAAYDVVAQIADAGPRMSGTYTAAFGTDPARQRALSPLSHAAAPNVAAFYFPHVQRADAVRQNGPMAAALNAAGSRAEVRQFDGRGLMGHLEINRRLGDPDYAATAPVDAWLAGVFAQRR